MKRVITSLLAILFVLPMVFPLAACTTETGGENMANYLYNGVALPDINTVWTDKETYPYAHLCVMDGSSNGFDGIVGVLTITSRTGSANSSGVVSLSAGSAYTYAMYGCATTESAASAAGLSDVGEWVLVTESGGSADSSFEIGAVTWSNYDILNSSDSSVYLAASNPVPAGGSKLTISTGGSANGDGMALYNGVMLPELPEWDKTAYPYACFAVYPGEEFICELLLSANKCVIDADGTGTVPSGGCQSYAFAQSQEVADALGISCGEWGYLGGGTDEYSWAVSPTWSNHDILNTDGSTYLAASDPIPLDGMNVITWDGDTTGMEVVEGLVRFGDYFPQPASGVAVLNSTLTGNNVLIVWDEVQSYPDFGEGVWVCGEFAIGLSDNNVIGLPSGLYFSVSGEKDTANFAYTQLFAYPASSGGEVTDTTATVNFSCTDLLYTDSVYRIKAWVYEPSGWSYNGVEMPELPVVDGCPYAVMYKSNNSYDLFLSAQKLYVNEGKTATYVSEAGDFVFYSEYISKSKQWHYQNTYPFSKDELHSRFSLANLCWSNYDILNADGSVYLAASEPVPGGLDVTQPATWTSDLFAGPSHSESHTFTGLTPATEYGIYAVIWSETDGAATEHNATAAFTTLEGEAPTGTIQFGAVNITGTGFTAVIEASGLDDATAYTAEIVVYNTATSAVAAEAVRSFTGNYTMAIDFAGLTPETDYTVAVDVYPTDTGKVVARGEFPVTTGVEEPTTSWRDSFLLGFASGLGCTAATKTDADHNAWMQGYIVGDALRSAITTQQGFKYEVPDLQATVRMVAECFTESGDTLLFNAHNGSMILGVSTQNEATFTDRTDVTKYLIPIPAEASKVTVETSDPKVTLAQFIGVNGSGGSYTKVFSSAREAVYSYEFPKGVAQYMAIDLIYEDKGAVTVPWDYVLADTTVTFT